MLLYLPSSKVRSRGFSGRSPSPHTKATISDGNTVSYPAASYAARSLASCAGETVYVPLELFRML